VAKKKKKPSDDDEKPGRKKGRGRADDDEDEDDEDEGATDEAYTDEEELARPRNDIYVGLGLITLLALLTAAVVLYMDADHYAKAPQQVTVNMADLKLAPRGQ
jgi:hypothetical protein